MALYQFLRALLQKHPSIFISFFYIGAQNCTHSMQKILLNFFLLHPQLPLPPSQLPRGLALNLHLGYSTPVSLPRPNPVSFINSPSCCLCSVFSVFTQSYNKFLFNSNFCQTYSAFHQTTLLQLFVGCLLAGACGHKQNSQEMPITTLEGLWEMGVAEAGTTTESKW